MCEANKQLMYRWFQQVWNEKNLAAVDDMFSADGKVHNFPQSGAVIGTSGFKEVNQNLCGAFPDIHVVVDDVVADNDRVTAHWIATMTNFDGSMDHLSTG